MHHLRLLGCLLALALGLGAAPAADLNALISDLQKTSSDGDRIDLVWWIPSVFWDEALKADGSLSESGRREFVGALKGITVLAVVSGKMGPIGGVRTSSREKILETLRVRANGKPAAPLEDDAVSPDAMNLISAMKPMMANMLGQIGQGMQFIVFENDCDGTACVDPAKEGAFEVDLAGETYRWRLPLGSLQPPRHDPETGEQFPGNYRFNPFTGKELVTR